jgi:hypothetical protein
MLSPRSASRVVAEVRRAERMDRNAHDIKYGNLLEAYRHFYARKSTPPLVLLTGERYECFADFCAKLGYAKNARYRGLQGDAARPAVYTVAAHRGRGRPGCGGSDGSVHVQVFRRAHDEKHFQPKDWAAQSLDALRLWLADQIKLRALMVRVWKSAHSMGVAHWSLCASAFTIRLPADL